MATPNEMKFVEAWRALDEETTRAGWNTLPIVTDSVSILLAGRHQPRNQESMLIGFTGAVLPQQASLPQCKGFSVENVELLFQGNRYYCLAITRHPSASLDIFSAMLDDIVTVLERTNRNEVDRISAVIERILGWQRFMSREEDGVLRAEDEVGLLGELHVLRLLIGSGIPISEVVDWWQGPVDSLHDFVCSRGDIEVKSSVRVGAFSANVVSLDQLDESLVQPLYLAAVQFSLAASGLRLPQHIDSVRDLLRADPTVITAFEGKLLAAGYHQVSAARYHRQFSYLLTSLYEVHADFPRLTKGIVPAGVVDAKYRLEIDASKYVALPLNDVLKRIG
jgi:hypothetical protein